jgi:ligand-binding sensor domain-containing protein
MRITHALGLILGALLVWHSESATAQNIELQPVVLPGGNFVPTLAEDSQGNMWFGTQQGVARWDGKVYTFFIHDPDNPGSVAFNYIEDVYVDRGGTVWVGTYGGGLSRFDAATQTFTSYRHDPEDPYTLTENFITALLEDRDGNFWVGTRQGLHRMDRATGRFTRYRHDANDPTTISHNHIRALHHDSRGPIWVGTQAGGLNRFDPARGTFTRFQHDPDDDRTLIEGLIGAIFEDSQGRIWIGSGRPTGGLNLLDRDRGTFTRFRFDPTSTDWPADPQPRGPWTGGGVTSIAEDVEGALWFGLWEGWFTRFDPRTGTAINFDLREKNPPTTERTNPFAIHQARDGTLWLASIYGGPVYRVQFRR